MALQVVPILKALAPLIANASEIAARIRTARSAERFEDRLRRMEEEAMRAGEVLAGVTQQLQALAEELKVQAEWNERQQKRVRVAWAFAGVSFAVAVAALVAATLG